MSACDYDLIYAHTLLIFWPAFCVECRMLFAVPQGTMSENEFKMSI